MTLSVDDKIANIAVEMVSARNHHYSKRQLQGLRTRILRLQEQDTTSGGSPSLTLALRELDSLIATK
jgi:hypothetical protein